MGLIQHGNRYDTPGLLFQFPIYCYARSIIFFSTLVIYPLPRLPDINIVIKPMSGDDFQR